MTPDFLALTGAAFLAAGLVKGMIGMGLPTVALGLLALAMAPAEAVALLILPTIATNVWQMFTGGELVALLRRFAWLFAAMAAVTVAAAGIMAGADVEAAQGLLGGALILYAVIGLSGVKLSIPPGQERRWSPAMGAATGVVAGATGIFVVPAAMFLQAAGLSRDALVQALGLCFTIGMVALAIGLAGRDAYDLGTAARSLAALPPALIGMWLGTRLRGRMSADLFRRCFLLGMLALGLNQALKAIL